VESKSGTIIINRSNKQINKTDHNNKEEDIEVDDEILSKENLINFKESEMNNIKKQKDMQEFEKILEIYPKTVNNTKEKEIEAFAIFRTLNSAQRFNLYQAIINYSKTTNVRNAQTSKYIQSIHTFLAKSYTKFIHDIPENYEYSQEFQKNSTMGTAVVCEIEDTEYNDGLDDFYTKADRQKMEEYALKIEELKSLINKGVREEEFENRVKELFTPLESEKIIVEMGGYYRLKDFKAKEWASGLFDSLYPRYDKNDDLIIYDENKFNLLVS